ncbi:uncharacterized protein TEOVI_000065800 [Trypanosoma equiperdum]|uniref:Uncharacterized protein n=2 Tax=Trypanozoon TaxID=39700 RepID=Q583I3_TRYB2|nr:hypothetical protein Tb927.4.2100 [Trypanosoma brucei brucei TREU927]AAX79766.1 hypothetical protein Tb927.4.2100 [Trypanosoma brucei]AAZ10801.1 hypothetical protein Tb927.4.2100 [Trypanosoma brucei brucei TREU927]SCU69101.1 hypothetical protein, conserved [Trypanosoma equiperdum]
MTVIHLFLYVKMYFVALCFPMQLDVVITQDFCCCGITPIGAVFLVRLDTIDFAVTLPFLSEYGAAYVDIVGRTGDCRRENGVVGASAAEYLNGAHHVDSVVYVGNVRTLWMRYRSATQTFELSCLLSSPTKIASYLLGKAWNCTASQKEKGRY